MITGRAVPLAIGLLSCLAWPAAAPAGIVGSKHDLSLGGPGPIQALEETEICIFCHAPHTASSLTPLWNRSASSEIYDVYMSTSLQAAPGQPSNSSRLCLSCHDGTIALGAVLSRPVPISMSGPLPAESDLESNLADDHPISFVYDTGLVSGDDELVDPSLLPAAVKLDENDEMQCTSCHDVHDTTYPDFLVVDNEFSSLCISCHEKRGWPLASHSSSGATWNGSGLDPWPHTDWVTVASNGCESCHAPHGAGFWQTLLNYPLEEDNCLSCHNGNGSSTDILTEIGKTYAHQVDTYFDVHDPVEDFGSMPRHAECHDCHNPHAATADPAVAPAASGPLFEVAGVTSGGTRTENASYQYEVCFRCHGDDAAAPAPAIERDILQTSVLRKFDPSNPSYHPVEATGRNPDVPSLIGGLDETSIIYCTDCHANDEGPGAGGAGPAGPHGSGWPFLLERQYETADYTSASLEAYALCYKCHDESVIMSQSLSFKHHSKHIESKDTPCSACHDPHGISGSQGNATNNAHLINFDTTIVFPDPDTGYLRFEDDTNPRKGKCYLECHGKKHSPKSY